MITNKSLLLLSLSVSILLVVGCGKSGPALYEASGTVTMDGEPLEGATVTFVSTAGAQLGGAARTDESGKFTIMATSGRAGITPGTFKVTVRKVDGEGFGGGPNATKEEKDKAMMDMMMERRSLRCPLSLKTTRMPQGHH